MSAAPSPQRFLNGEIHDWYRIILGYSDHLVAKLIDRFELEAGSSVVDPFCGTGTTLIECMKRGIHSVGIDVNPSSVFAARVKTNWGLTVPSLLMSLEALDARIQRRLNVGPTSRDLTYQYITQSGMVERGWINDYPLRQAIALKALIERMAAPQACRDFFMLALITEVVHGASNVKFGPELYCGPSKRDVDVGAGFLRRAERMILDLTVISETRPARVSIYEGDARRVGPMLRDSHSGRFNALISSPPYPAEHDYTRNSRLELALLGQVTGLASLRACKRQMVRSHTKGIYVDDSDYKWVKDNQAVERLATRIERKVRTKTHGFARYYGAVVREYFGGMKRHLSSVRGRLLPGANLAYVVGDQSCYGSVDIPTGKILADIADECGYEVVEIEHWRTRRSSATSNCIGEHIVFLRVPVKNRRRGAKNSRS